MPLAASPDTTVEVSTCGPNPCIGELVRTTAFIGAPVERTFSALAICADRSSVDSLAAVLTEEFDGGANSAASASTATTANGHRCRPTRHLGGASDFACRPRVARAPWSSMLCSALSSAVDISTVSLGTARFPCSFPRGKAAGHYPDSCDETHP